MPNNRQLAVMIWLLVALVFALRSARVRSSLAAVGRSLFNATLLIPIVSFLVLVSGLLVGGSQVGLWNLDLATDTGFWVVGSGSILLFNFDRAIKADHYFRRVLAEILGVTILVELVLEISILAIPYELVLVPTTILLAAMEVVAIRQPEHARVAGCAKTLLAIIGFLIFGVGLFRAATDFDGLDLGHLGRQALLPIWLTLGILPFVYLLALYARYEWIGNLIDWRSQDSWHRRVRVKVAIVREYGLKARQLGELNGGVVTGIARAGTWTEARRAIKQHKARLEAQRVEQRATNARLEQYAGVDGVDEDGRRLDRREFEETCSALRWLHNCHSGWWRQDERYVSGLLERISSPTDRQGLAPGAGYHEVVEADGASWYGWRRTTSDWVFAIGAAGPPPDQWLYDGPIPPSGPPGVDPAWGDSPFATTSSPNWD